MMWAQILGQTRFLRGRLARIEWETLFYFQSQGPLVMSVRMPQRYGYKCRRLRGARLDCRPFMADEIRSTAEVATTAWYQYQLTQHLDIFYSFPRV
jgi:hypothetical protein